MGKIPLIFGKQMENLVLCVDRIDIFLILDQRTPFTTMNTP